MSRWTKTGSAVIVPPPIERFEEIDGPARSYERIRAKVTYPEPVSSKAEAYAARMVRLAKRRAACPTCGALTGQRCRDLTLLPTKAFALGFHRARKMLPPPDTTVTPMTRLPSKRALCKCGHRRIDHRNRTGKCSECRCRTMKETP
jgi:hypothetical protein